MARLTLTFLGSFQASLDGAPLRVQSARIQALLAYLALESARAHTREALAALFWPDEPDQVAKQNLRQALYQLRQLLGEQTELFVLITRDTVQFSAGSDHVLDVSTFLQHLKQARLKEAVIKRLAGHFRKDIIAYVTARQCDGGLGALYVLLRKK
jgi:DNA-binding SARP family transcriptional activator